MTIFPASFLTAFIDRWFLEVLTPSFCAPSNSAPFNIFKRFLCTKCLWSCMDVRVGLWRRWAPNNWCFWTVVLEKTLVSPFDYKEIQPVHPKGDQSWVFIGRTDAKAETPILWPHDAKSWLIGKDPDAETDWGQEGKGMTDDKMAGWHHWLDGHGFGWTLGVGDGQGGLACCDSWGCKELDTTEWLNWTEVLHCTLGIQW